MIENLEWLGIVLMWFWPITLGAIAIGALAVYVIYKLAKALPDGTKW